jgi:hypothetical protein
MQISLTVDPDQIAFDTMPAWYPLPGTAGKYQFSIKRTAGTVRTKGPRI